jgi:hypothetical protein
MAYTKHGHHIRGTMYGDPPKSVENCGGYESCVDCSREMQYGGAIGVVELESRSITPEDVRQAYQAADVDIIMVGEPVNYQRLAKILVSNWVVESGETEPFEVYVIWFCKTLQNWKAIVATTLPDNRIFEVTHNGDRHETYLDVYEKTVNRVYPDKE